MPSEHRTPPACALVALICGLCGASACSSTIEGSASDGPATRGGGSPSAGGRNDAAVGDPGPGMKPGQPAADDPAQQPSACDLAADPGPAPLQRLTRAQYVNSVRALFGDVPELERALGASGADDTYEFGLVQPDVAPVELETYQVAAELIAGQVTAAGARLRAIAPCADDAEPRACARTFVEAFGARVYRAPLHDDADVARHLALYDAGAQTSHARGIELVLRGMLQAPRFLYRVELGTSEAAGAHAIRLSGYEIATRLAYLVWNSAPDAELDRAAGEGELDSQAGVRARLSMMLADERGRHAMRTFVERWLQLPRLSAVVKDEAMFPAWRQADLPSAMAEQATRLIDDVLGRQGGTLRALLTSTSVFANRDLGAYYGVDTDDDFERFERDDGHTAGVLTLPAFLSLMAKPDESSPIYRGKFVREALLCHTLPAPPPNIPKPPDVMPGVSTRERLAQHEVDPACSGCHRLMDPIGFGFENYDAVGRYREDDQGDAIDGRGELVDTRDVDGAFSGVAELGQILAGSAEVRECVARQFFRFALARFEREADACSIARLVDAFEASGDDLNALPAALIATDAFVYRHPLDQEEAP